MVRPWRGARLRLRATRWDRQENGAVVREMACPYSSIFLPAARCSRNLRRPRARSHSHRGICAGRVRPAPSPTRNTPPSKDALPAAAWGNNRLRPSAPSRRHIPSPRSCCARIRPRQSSPRQACRAQSLPPALAGNHFSPALAPGISCSLDDHPQTAATLLNLPPNQLKSLWSSIQLRSSIPSPLPHCPLSSILPNELTAIPPTVYHPFFIPHPCSTRPSATTASCASSAKAGWASSTKPKIPSLAAASRSNFFPKTPAAIPTHSNVSSAHPAPPPLPTP